MCCIIPVDLSFSPENPPDYIFFLLSSAQLNIIQLSEVNKQNCCFFIWRLMIYSFPFLWHEKTLARAPVNLYFIGAGNASERVSDVKIIMHNNNHNSKINACNHFFRGLLALSLRFIFIIISTPPPPRQSGDAEKRAGGGFFGIKSL